MLDRAPDLVLVLFFLGTLAWAAIVDLGRRRIPNAAVVLVVGLSVTRIAFGDFRDGDWDSSSWLSGIAFVGAVLGFYSVGMMGAGDAKLLAAALLFIGPASSVQLALAVALCGGALAIVWIVSRRLTGGVPGRDTRLPYAVAIAGGAVMTLLASGSG
jgi:prepilin peptidase CpaA